MSKILRVAARVFGYPGFPNGGNPVTVFLLQRDPSNIIPKTEQQPSEGIVDSHSSASSEFRENLASKCEFESVFVEFNRLDDPIVDTKASSSSPSSKFYFYMPSGEEVSFCAHAAMGACATIQNQKSWIIQNYKLNLDATPESEGDIIKRRNLIRFTSNLNSSIEQKAFIDDENNVELVLDGSLQEEEVENSNNVINQLLSQIGLSRQDIMETKQNDDDNHHHPSALLPCYINSSIARYKTLIPLKSVEQLHSATNPQDAKQFQILCDSIQSTGLYLYAKSNPISTHSSSHHNNTTPTFECRQFPRASGYPEDAATGIAAACLAKSLHKRGILSSVMDVNGVRNCSVDMIQGTAMNRRSLIQIRIVEDTILYCSGFVDIDSMEEIML